MSNRADSLWREDGDEEEAKKSGSFDGSDTTRRASLERHAPATKPSRRRRVLNHYKKWWWVHVIAIVLVLLIITLLIIFVAFPRIAQRSVNRASLSDVTQVIDDPTPSSVHVALNATVHSHTHWTPTLDAFNASFYLPQSGRENPFGYLEIPRLHATSRANVSLSQRMEIVNMTEFIKYNRRVLLSENYEVSLYGRTGLHLGALPTTTVTFQKTLLLKGLNALRGLAVSNVSISLTSAPDGTNMNGTAYIPNPSAMTLSLGNITLDLSVSGSNVGTTYISNLTLEAKSNNTVPIRSSIDQARVLGFISDTYTNGVLPLDLTGNSSSYDGQRLEYYEEALRSNTAMLDLDVAPALAAVGVNVSALTGL